MRSVACVHSLLVVKAVQIPFLSLAASSINRNVLTARPGDTSKREYWGCKQNSQILMICEMNFVSSSKEFPNDSLFFNGAIFSSVFHQVLFKGEVRTF